VQRPLPEDFCDHDHLEDDLDIQWALQGFLGLTIRQAEVKFAGEYIGGYDSLGYLAPTAYCYYALAALRHLTGDWDDECRADDVVLGAFLSTVEDRLARQPDEIRPIAPILWKAAQYFLVRLDRFASPDYEHDNYSFQYDKLRERCVSLVTTLGTIASGSGDDPRSLEEILTEVADASDREPDRLHPVERRMLEAIVRAVEAGRKVTGEDDALALIAPAGVAEARSFPAYFAAFNMLRRRRGLVAFVQDARGGWEIRPTEAAAERLRQENGPA
jgi:hypothetical protein